MNRRRRGLPRGLRGPVVDAWAGGFGVALGSVAGAALALEVAVARRLLSPAGSS